MKRELGSAEIKLTYHRDYFTIARKHLWIARTIEKNANSILPADGLLDGLQMQYASDAYSAILQGYIVVVVFCALAFEAFINHYGLENFSRSYFDKHLDKLSPVSKCIVFPKLVVGKEINTDTQAYELLEQLFKIRNRLVHYKSKTRQMKDFEKEEWGKADIMKKYAEDAFEGVKLITKELAKLDPSIDTSWLEKKKRKKAKGTFNVHRDRHRKKEESADG